MYHKLNAIDDYVLLLCKIRAVLDFKQGGCYIVVNSHLLQNTFDKPYAPCASMSTSRSCSIDNTTAAAVAALYK